MLLKKKTLFVLFLLVLFVASNVSALDLEVKKIEKTPVVISELSDPAVFDFIFDNKGSGENIEIYSLVGVSFEPRGTFFLPTGQSTREVKAFPAQSLKEKEGNYAFEYQIKGEGDDIFKDQLVVKIVKLKNVLEIKPQSISYGDKIAIVNIRNVQNVNLEKASLSMKSVFFEKSTEISLEPFESIDISMPIAGGVEDLAAGPYIVTSELEVNGIKSKIENTASYREKQNVISASESKGLLVRTTKITHRNEGNLNVLDRIDVTKNILTRLFTTFSSEPLSSNRNGLVVYYRWEKDLKPGELWDVEVKTNYTLPFVLILLIAFSAWAVYIYSRTAVVLRKRCSFVRTRGGEFALKVILNLKARKSVDNIEVFDRIPSAMKLYEKAGMPHKFDEKLGRLNWKVDRLNAGEERIFSYIIYSNLRIVGRLGLSPATAHFVHEGKSSYINSNRTYFVSDVAPAY